MTLRAVAVSAPDCVGGFGKGKHAINSADPASLFNACRYAALLAKDGVRAWGKSNWVGTRADRRQKFLLMYSLEEDLPYFEELLLRERPNLLLIGAMTICYPGAIACAKRAKELFGDEIYVVLGGRHVNETLYENKDEKKNEVRRNNLNVPIEHPVNSICHHAGSPLLHMHQGRIPRVFDLVVSGDGELIIAKIGELVSELTDNGISLTKMPEHFDQFNNVPGNWILGWVDEDTDIDIIKNRDFEDNVNANDQTYIHTLISPKIPMDYNRLPAPTPLFGIHAAFDVFDGRMTAHAFSDTGRGCAYDCHFCSERRSVAGTLQQLDTSAKRLYRQLEAAYQTISTDSPNRGASAFIEDSLLLAGNIRAMNELADLLTENPIDIHFGAQLSIDQILGKKEVIKRLAKVGLKYFFIGLETLDPTEIGGMSKDTKQKQSPWVERAEQVFEFLNNENIKCGAAILFGLGESHKSRMTLLRQAEIWRERYGKPTPISMNWAVQHPLMGNDVGANYDYLEWATPKGPYLEVFHDFGEASLLYPIKGVAPPVLEEIREIRDYLVQINGKQNGG